MSGIENALEDGSEIGGDPAIPKGAYSVSLGIAVAGFVGLLIFVFAFGKYGDRLTAGVDVACAEAAFRDGKDFEASGNYEQAIVQFRQALEGRFAVKEREYVCVRSIGEILFKLERHAEAVDTFRSLPEEAFGTPGSYTAYVTALVRTGDRAEAERLGTLWLAKAEEAQDAQQRLWAHSALGRVYLDANLPRKAVEQYRAAEGIDPTGDAGILVAQALRQLGRSEEAVQQLDAFLGRVTSGQLHEDAKSLRAQYQNESKPGA